MTLSAPSTPVKTEPFIFGDTYPMRVLLVDDQPIIAESIRGLLREHPEIDFQYCSDPTQAIEMANACKPTVILQDLVMPHVDGLILVKYFRANPETKNIPLVVLSSTEDAKVKAEAFAFGANDYLVKVPKKEELVARILYHSKNYIRFLERNYAFEKLEESQQRLKKELNEAAGYVRSLLPAELNEEIRTEWRFIPSTELGGDAFGYHWLDADHFAFYLLDVCGHGVGAALLSITVINVLRAQTLPDTDFHSPSDVLQSLNSAFPMEKHQQMFFTIWYGVFNSKKREIIYASGGHPPALLFTGESREQAKRVRLETGGVVVGGLENSVFSEATCKLGKFNTMLLFSDGVFEIQKKDENSMISFSDFVEIADNSVRKGDKVVEHIVTEISEIKGNQSFDDDFSILLLQFP